MKILFEKQQQEKPANTHMHRCRVNDNIERTFIINWFKAGTKYQIYCCFRFVDCPLVDSASILKAFIYMPQVDELSTRATSDKSWVSDGKQQKLKLSSKNFSKNISFPTLEMSGRGVCFLIAVEASPTLMTQSITGNLAIKWSWREDGNHHHLNQLDAMPFKTEHTHHPLPEKHPLPQYTANSV